MHSMPPLAALRNGRLQKGVSQLAVLEMAATPSGESDAAAQPCPLRIYTVDDLGLLKVVEATSLEQLEAAQVVHKWGEPDRAQCIDRLCTAVGAATQTSNMLDAGLDLLGVGRANGRVELFEFARGGLRGGVAPTACARGEEEDVRIRGLAFLQHAVGPANRQPSVLSCTLAGTVRIHGAVSSDEATQQEWHEQATWAVPRDVDALAVDGSSARLAVGCQGTELTVWDIATRQRLYLAKGNKPNRIGLVDKPWNAAVAFLPGPDSNKIMTGTGHHKLRLYDMRQRRPALDIAFAESRVTALAPEADGARCWASNGKGQVEVLDLAAAKMGGALQGVGGAVRGLSLHPDLPLLASVGLDRYLRVHNTQTRKLCAKVYLKQQLTGVAFGSPPVNAGAAVGAAAAEVTDTKRPAEEAEAEPLAKSHTKRRRKHHGASQ